MIIDGHKKKAKKPRQPYIAADSARSKSYAKLLMALGEGEVEGSGNGLLDERDILLDGVPIINPDGSRNFDVKYEFRKGSLDQDYIPAMPMVESDTNVGFALKQTTPFVRSINNTQVDQIRFRFSWPQLVDNKSNGDRVGTSVTYAIDVAEGAGSFVEYQRHTLSEKSTSKYERSHTVDLPRSTDGWRVRVRRLTADSTSDMLQNAMFVEAYTEIIDAKLTYPNTALLYLEFDAEQFPQIPKVSVRMKGRVVRVPENYNPTTRQYNGIWDGRFKWAYTNNPAWCYLDMLLTERFALGVRIGLEQVDKWALYDIARWCDVMVPDGEGGMQPRHTLNVYINTAQDAWRILGDLASVFNGVTYWNGEQLEVQADTLRDAEYEFTMANIVDGVIEYSSIARKDKYSQIAVKYDDPDNEFQTDTVAVNDLSMTRRFGVVQSQMAAFGCTNRAEAQRKGKWALISNKYDRSAIWKTGLDGYIPKVGSVVRTADNALAGAAIGGRVKLTVDDAIQLDRAPRAQVGDKLNINMPDGKSQQRTLTVVDGDMVRVDAPYTNTVQAGSQWSVDAADLAGQLFKIISIQQDSKTQFTIQGVEYNRGKFDYVDNGANIEDRPISITPVGEQAPPTNPVVSSFSYVEQGLAITNARFDWDGAVGALYYDVEWRKDNMQWVSTARTGTTGMDIEGVYTGAYEFRVRAVNAGGIASVYAHSLPVVITGKVGAPPALAYLRTVSKVMGIELQWGFPAQGAEDAALVEIHYSLAPDDQNAQLLGEYSYPTGNHTLMGLAHAVELYFKGRIIDRTGNIGPWSDWVYGASSSNSDEILSYIDGKIGETQLDGFLKGEIGKIDALEQQIADFEAIKDYDPEMEYAKGDMVKLSGAIYAALETIPTNSPPPSGSWEKLGDYDSLNGLLSATVLNVKKNTTDITQTESGVTANSDSISLINASLNDPDTGLNAQASALQSLVTDVEEIDGRVTATAQSVTNLEATVNDGISAASAAVQSLQSAVADESAARAQDISTVQASFIAEIDKINGVVSVVDLTSLNSNLYYPILLSMVASTPSYSFMVDVPLSKYSAPWATHNSGTFSCTVIWDTTPSGWGARGVERDIKLSEFKFSGQSPYLDVGQLTNSSGEYIFLRGGAKYDVTTPEGVPPRIIKTSETISGQTIAPKPYNLDSVTKSDKKQITAAVETISRVLADADGKLSSMWGVRMRQGTDGKWVTAGIGLGIENVNGVDQSQFIVDANLFAVRNGVNGSQKTAFAVQNGQVIMNEAIIGNGTITMLKIGGDLYSTNYVAGISGWKLSRDGELEFNATYAGQGRIRLNSNGLYVYDAVNNFPRVKIGNLNVG